MRLFVLLTLGSGFLIAWLLAFVVRRYAPRFGFVDKPGGRKQHAAPTPTAGGLAIYAGVVAPLVGLQLLLWLGEAGVVDVTSLPALLQTHWQGLVARSWQLWAILSAGTVLLLLGLADDRRGLDWRFRIAVEAAVAAAMVAAGFRLTFFVDIPWVTAIVTVLWIVALVNSFNMLDNMDGLSAGVAAIAAALLATVMLTAPNQPQLFVAGMLLLATGSLMGFLAHNHHPARLFMGDAGSYFTGFFIAMMTLLSTYAGGNLPRHAILAPLCVLAIPLYDLVSVVWIRLRAKRSPFAADTNHFSHRLVALGLSRKHAVWTIYLASLTCGLGALLLYQIRLAGAIVVMAMVLCVLAIIAVLEITGLRRLNESDATRRKK